MINLNNETRLTVKINKKFYYSFKEHGSVGITAEYIIDDESIVKCIKQKVKYNYPLRVARGMSGADSATGTFIFKALKEGSTIITIKHLFRGKTEGEKRIEIIVVK